MRRNLKIHKIYGEFGVILIDETNKKFVALRDTSDGLFKEQKKPKKDVGGQSGMFDLTIHDECFKRIALIEFKALNPKESCFTKDFLKLREEGKEILTYFIMYIKSYRSDTIAQLYDKIFNATDDDKINYKDTNTNLHCFALKPPKGKPNIVEFNHNSNNSKK